MIILKIIGILFLVFVILFLLSLVIYFFNLDMKFASLMVPVMKRWYDFTGARRERKKKCQKKASEK